MPIEFEKDCLFLTEALQVWLRKQIEDYHIMIADAIRQVAAMRTRWHLDATISYRLPGVRDGHSYGITVQIEHDEPAISIESTPPEDVVGIVRLPNMQHLALGDSQKLGEVILDALT